MSIRLRLVGAALVAAALFTPISSAAAASPSAAEECSCQLAGGTESRAMVLRKGAYVSAPVEPRRVRPTVVDTTPAPVTAPRLLLDKGRYVPVSFAPTTDRAVPAARADRGDHSDARRMVLDKGRYVPAAPQ